jgi:hypothetical protein
VPGVRTAFRFLDDDGVAVDLDQSDGPALFAALGDLDAATVSSCPECGARVLAAVALVDLIDAGAPHPRAADLRDLAEDAPTLHIFLVDETLPCRHRYWRDPLADEWYDVTGDRGPPIRR